MKILSTTSRNRDLVAEVADVIRNAHGRGDYAEFGFRSGWYCAERSAVLFECKEIWQFYKINTCNSRSRRGQIVIEWEAGE